MQERLRGVRQYAPQAISLYGQLEHLGARIAAVKLPVCARIVVLRADAISGAIHAALPACFRRAYTLRRHAVSVNTREKRARTNQSLLHDKALDCT